MRRGRVWRMLMWVVLAASVALTGWGFYATRLWAEEAWEALGLQRLEIFAAVFAAIAIPLLIWKPRWLLPLSIAVVVVYTVCVTGPIAPCAVILFLSAALAVGSWLSRDRLLALLLGMALYILLAYALFAFPINYPLVWGALLIIPIFFNQYRSFPRRFHIPERDSPIGIAMTIFAAMALWLVVLKPEVSSDGLAMHLAIPAYVANHHTWPFDAANTIWAVMPMGADFCYTIVYLLGGEYAARLLNFAILLTVAALLFRMVRSWLITALWLSTPLTQLVTGSLFVENFTAAMLMGAFVSLWQQPVWLTAILLGAGMSIKFGFAAFAIPCFALLFTMRLPEWRMGLAATALFILFAAPPYLNAYARTRNPIFPFANAVFKSPYYDTRVSFRDLRFQQPVNAALLYNMTFHTSRYFEGQDGAFGFQYLLLLPAAAFALFYKRRKRVGAAALALCVLFCVLTFASQSNVRYLYPALPLAMIAIGSLPAGAPVAILAAVGFTLNFWYMGAASWDHRAFYLRPFDARERAAYLERSAPVRKLVEWLNQNKPGKPVLFLATSEIAGLQGRALTNSWHNPDFNKQLYAANSTATALALLNKYDIQWIVAPDPSSTLVVPQIGIRNLVACCTDPKMKSGRFYLAHLREQTGAIGGIIPAGPGLYDDSSPAIHLEGQWVTDMQFPTTLNHSVSYSNVAGDRATFRFEGSGVDYVYTKAANRGIAEIFIDGKPAAPLDLYSRVTVWQARTAINCSDSGVHQLTIGVTGRKNSASSDTYVDLDGLEVRK
jgi:hypothetical protein